MADSSSEGWDQNMTRLAVAGAVVVGSVLVAKALTPAPAKVLKVPITFDEDEKSWSKYETGKNGTSTSVKAEAIIRYADKGFASKEHTPAMIVPEVLRLAAKKKGDKPVLRAERNLPPYVKGEKIPPSKPVEEWDTTTYSQYLSQVEQTAKGLIALGLERFDAVAIFGFNCPEWFVGEMGAIMAGGVAAGVYPTDTPAQVYFKARHSGVAVVLCEDMKKAKTFLDRAKDLPKLKSVVVWGGEDFKDYEENGVKVLTWDSMQKVADGVKDSDLEARVQAQKPGNVCAYIYTSGTTGNPKAVMITHDNIIIESRNVFELVPHLDRGGQERVLSYLPLSHVAGMMVDIICPIVIAALTSSYLTVHFARIYDLKVGTFGDRLRAVRPTLFLGVPRVWEKIAEKMKAMVAANPLTGLKLKVAKWSKGVGLQHQNNCQLGGNGAKAMGYGIAQKKVLDVVRQRLGLDACEFAFTGAAPITTDTLEYFGALGIQINEVYGMSECTGATSWSTDEAHVWGSCGWALPGMEVKVILDGKECPRASSLAHPEQESQGEICFRGRHIMLGYMANPDLGQEHMDLIGKKTSDAIDADGWLHSGDKGCMDSRGMVKITGRYKELIIGAGGENIAPVPLEDNVKKLHAGISNIMMVGDKRKFNIALVTLKAKGATGVSPGGNDLDTGALEIKEGVTTVSAACKDEDWIKSVTDAIVATNKDGDVCPSNAAKIQKFTILPRDFSVETDEFTPTYKLKRSVVDKKYRAIVEKMYLPENAKKAYIPFE